VFAKPGAQSHRHALEQGEFGAVGFGVVGLAGRGVLALRRLAQPLDLLGGGGLQPLVAATNLAACLVDIPWPAIIRATSCWMPRGEASHLPAPPSA
jgi:hypothetical protein